MLFICRTLFPKNVIINLFYSAKVIAKAYFLLNKTLGKIIGVVEQLNWEKAYFSFGKKKVLRQRDNMPENPFNFFIYLIYISDAEFTSYALSLITHTDIYLYKYMYI